MLTDRQTGSKADRQVVRQTDWYIGTDRYTVKVGRQFLARVHD